MILLNLSNCLSEESFSLTHEDLSAFGGIYENSCSFTSHQTLRSFLLAPTKPGEGVRAAYKLHQNENCHSERFCLLFPRRISSYIDSSSNAFVRISQRDKSESLRGIFLRLVTKQSYFKSFEKPVSNKRDDCRVTSLLTMTGRG